MTNFILNNSLIDKKVNLLNLNYEQLRTFFISIGEKPFCADQIMRWIYQKYCINFYKMTNISKSLRKKLQSLTCIITPNFIEEQRSLDGTIKWRVVVGKHMIETVYIPDSKRATLCISSQSGCILNCSFCSTGTRGFGRNLVVSEIVGQVWKVFKFMNDNKLKKMPNIKNIVMMGMGEPLLNFNNVVHAIKILLDDKTFKISKRHITLSTSGIVPGINKLKSVLDIRLAISLHAPNDELRNKIMPINYKYNINSILTAVKNYIKSSKANNGGITIEYVMLSGVNDSSMHAKQLAMILSQIPSKINLIPWNSILGSNYLCSSADQIINFSQILIKSGFVTTIRKPRGQDISAACGQLSGNIFDNFKN